MKYYAASAILGVCLATMLLPVLNELGEMGRDLFDDVYPPASIEATQIPAATQPHEVIVGMVTTKRRECALIRVQAFDVYEDGTSSRVTIERVDHKEAENLPAGVMARSTPWRIYPVHGSRIHLYTDHQCGNRVVRARVVDMGVK